jgi:hypothetical protein
MHRTHLEVLHGPLRLRAPVAACAPRPPPLASENHAGAAELAMSTESEPRRSGGRDESACVSHDCGAVRMRVPWIFEQGGRTERRYCKP